jgi:nucleotide-binding universal stress UspA family protein
VGTTSGGAVVDGIVVGVDESAGAAGALRWAAQEGRIRGLPVTAVMTWGYLDQHHAVPGTPFDSSYSEADALAALNTIVDAVLDGPEAASVARQVVIGLAAPALLETARGADLLVVGARGLGGFKELLLGSVSQHVLHHAEVPVAVVRGELPTPGGSPGRIVVGVDGSATARRALAWALDEARLRKAPIEVVHAWQMPLVATPYVVPGTVLEEAANEVLAASLAEADQRGLVAPVVATVRGSGAAWAILDAAADADLVVVGSRGRGGFVGRLLGSVSNQVTHHAPCPVVVIPPG